MKKKSASVSIVESVVVFVSSFSLYLLKFNVTWSEVVDLIVYTYIYQGIYYEGGFSTRPWKTFRVHVLRV